MDSSRNGNQKQEGHDQRRPEFTRGEQLAILRSVRMPEGLTGQDGRTVSRHLAKSILRAIDDYGRECYATIETIADNVGCSFRHARRAIEALRAAGFIAVKRRRSPQGVSCNHYQIQWDQVTTRGHMVEGDQVTTVSDQVTTVSDQVTTVSDQVTTRGHKKRKEAQKKRKEAQRGRKGAQPEKIPIPEKLQTSGFQEAWREWLAYRRERRLTCSTTCLERQLRMLAGLGAESAIETVERSITNGWAGLFPDRGKGKPQGRRVLPGERYDPDAKDVCDDW